jgi:hypothetical protein
MGDVWEAQRDDGAYEARVAVKVLQAGRDSAALLQHFAQEQRLLARLSHPHIARLLDAGRTADDRPYFVMEAVDGRALDDAARGLPLAARLRLFLQLADAVAHAHHQGLVHRDLKPANVLVTADGQVKLLDFGIAMALDQVPDAPDAPRPLTPGYASPEQVRGEPVTAASDVYSLGVLLHVLVTGVRPYGRGTTTAQAALRAVLDEAPTRPSQATADTSGDPGVPRRQLAGDLDAIVLKALSKTVAGRYASVDTLADDVRAALAWQPVQARPRTLAYVAGRFVRRHRGVVAASLLALLAVAAALGATAWQARDAAAALALAALAAGLGVSAWQARLAAQARDEAKSRLAQTSGLVRDILMRYADMATYLPGGLRIKAELLKDTIAYLDRLRFTAPGDAELAGEVAKACSRLADMQLPGLDATLEEPEEALLNAERALALFAQAEPAHRDDPDFFIWWARALRVRHEMQHQRGELQAALDTSHRMRSFLQTTLRRFPGHYGLRFEYGSVLVGIGQANDTWVLPSMGRAQQALEAFAAAEAVYAELARDKPQDSDVPYQLGTIAGAQMIVMKKLGRLHEAAAAGRRAVAYREQALALQPDNTGYREGTAGERSNCTMVLLEAGLVDEALAMSARGEQLILALEADDPGVPTWAARRRIFAMHRGRALLHAGQAAEALPRLQDALDAMAAATSGPALGRRGWCRLELARALHAVGRLPEAQTSLHAATADLQQWLQQQPGDGEASARLRAAQALADELGMAQEPPGV